MTEKQKKLENLLVDEQKISEELLYDLLNEYVRIGEQNGRIFHQEPFQDLSSGEKIVTILATQMARKELDMVDSEWMSPSEISEDSGVKKGTVHPKVRELKEEGVIESNGDGSYRLPAHSVERAREYIFGGDGNE
jgi:DNA-binding transcriptional ArsR family regulator